MKKLFLLAIICVPVLSTSSFALVRLGVKGGVNLANVTSDANIPWIIADLKLKPGFISGVSAEIAIPLSGFTVRGELLYVQKGTKYSTELEDVRVNEDEVVFAPFLVLKTPAPLFFQVGPEFGINVRDNIDIEGRSYDSNGHWKTTSISMNFGAG